MKTFIKIHKWLGVLIALFMIVFSLSGIFLNHRHAIAGLDISRSILPDTYEYKNWNNSAVKGSLKIAPDSILLYGGSGIWLTDSLHTEFTPYIKGMHEGADNRNTINIIKTGRNEIFAITTFDLYQFDESQQKWNLKTDLLDVGEERLADISFKGDSIVVISRSHAHISTYPYTSFEEIELKAPEGYQKEVSMFRAFWTLHSGEMFGLIGKLFVDFIGVVFIILSITGIILLFFPKIIKKVREKDKKQKYSQFFKSNLKWHNKLGAWFLLFSIIVIVSGTFLRPPAMIFIIKDKMKPIPGTMHDTDNPWFEKLRNIRYDRYSDEWFMYTSNGFFKMKSLSEQPEIIRKAPRVSVMGVNVMEEIAPNLWVVGSFSGLYYWEKQSGMSVDISQMRPLFSGEQKMLQNIVEPQRGVIGGVDVSGYSKDFSNKEIIFSYSVGALSVGKPESFAPMPDEVKDAKMSLWHVSLEAHVGRIYTFIVNGVMGESYFILLSGIMSLLVFVSGYIIYWKRHRRRKTK
ncbi:PepSY domain-containing protein [Dysgonomonas sp. Marseille-P4361]|uniref:PepSY domain-containing protein n=1 Tax=Dysgonomonas sp. Marseille-P4361 TaxID=2161820 RepID=UPI000D561F36|nr:PepSY domain-containing protein [Dysgonomonas sp. Marseille-P4361]